MGNVNSRVATLSTWLSERPLPSTAKSTSNNNNTNNKKHSSSPRGGDADDGSEAGPTYGDIFAEQRRWTPSAIRKAHERLLLVRPHLRTVPIATAEAAAAAVKQQQQLAKAQQLLQQAEAEAGAATTPQAKKKKSNKKKLKQGTTSGKCK